MKPSQSFPDNLPKYLTRLSRRKHSHPLTDAHYQTGSFGGARSEEPRRAKPLTPVEGSSSGELQREARRSFLAEAAIFAVIVVIVAVAFVVCAQGLSEFLQAIAVFP